MINMNFNHRVVIDTNASHWISSPMAGVWRKPLAREEVEQGHATSIVRYDPGSSFRQHDHPFGEEILVLKGIFSDETGDYPEGTYLRNPEGFRHAPFSKEGCILLVKLHQFQGSDTAHVVVDSRSAAFVKGVGNAQTLLLHQHKKESVALVCWPAGDNALSHCRIDGEETYVISGALSDELGSYPAGCWIRNPLLREHRFHVEEDTLIWVKTGHLPS